LEDGNLGIKLLFDPENSDSLTNHSKRKSIRVFVWA